MAANSPVLSLAIPLNNEAGTLNSLYQEIKAVLDEMGIPYEIIFVNDASADETPKLLRQIKRTDSRVRVIEHKQNYGEAAGISSGCKFFRGDILVTMDGDGQNDPRDIPQMVQKIKEGYKAVTGWRKKRKEKYLTRIFPSIVANKIISFITGVNSHDNGCGLKAYSAEVVRGVIIPHGFHRFLPAVLGVKSKDVAEVRVNDRRRTYGLSHYGLSRTKEVIRELLTIQFVIHNPKFWLPVFRLLSTIFAGITLGLLGLFVFDQKASVLLITCLSLGVTTLLKIIFKNLVRVITIREKADFQKEEWVGESIVHGTNNIPNNTN
jgi:glycosyltransferase involved in cell wall biosynthesis